MKTCLIFLFFIVLGRQASAQLSINTDKELTITAKSVAEFVKDNHFDYALIAWYESTWGRMTDDFYCLLKQNKKWYLAKINAPWLKRPNQEYSLKVNEKSISVSQADLLLSDLKPNSTFMIKQADLDSLHGCKYNIYDVGTYFILKFDHHQTQSLKRYAPVYYLQKCYPQILEYGILKGIVNTTDGLVKAVKQQLEISN